MTDRSRLRLAMLAMLIVGLFASLFARMWYLQVVSSQRDQAQTLAKQNLTRKIYIEARRGRVLDTKGNVLIDNRLVNEVVIDKYHFNETIPDASDQRDFAIKLARELSKTGYLIKAGDIEQALAAPQYNEFQEVPIATDVPERFSILIGEREHDFPGVHVRKTTVRHYPYGERAAHLLGYVGPISEAQYAERRTSPKLYQQSDLIGVDGVEASLEDLLRGTPGVEVIEVDADNNRITTLSATDPIPGQDVRLTIDINLQALVEDELARGIRDARNRDDESDKENPVPFEAPGGAMVVLDPDGAKILAMASYPTFDQRFFLQEVIPYDEYQVLRLDPDGPLLNRAASAGYPPGSTFKLITAYAALDSGLLGDRGFLGRDAYLLDDGIWRIDDCSGPGCTIENAGQKPLGSIRLEEAISQSSNVFFGQLGFQFNVRQGFKTQQLIDVASDFGYGVLPDAVHGARAGGLAPPPSAGASANLAVGQGAMESSPIQMANSYAVIANRGKLYAPMLAEAAYDAATGEQVRDFPKRLLHELHLPDEYYEPLIRGLQGVVDEDGTAEEAFETFPLGRFGVLGKTGTVEVPPKQDNAAFAAFGPWPNPRYAMVAYIEEAGLGGDAAAPVVARVFRRIADGDIDTVPTEAEADRLFSQSQAIEEQQRLQSEQESIEAAERAAVAAEENPGFEVMVPGGDQASGPGTLDDLRDPGSDTGSDRQPAVDPGPGSGSDSDSDDESASGTGEDR